MTSSPQWTPTVEPEGGADVEFDLLVDESTAPSAATQLPPEEAQFVRLEHHSSVDFVEADSATGWTSDPEVITVSEVVTDSAQPTGSHVVAAAEYSAATGLPGRGVIVIAGVATAATVVLDLTLVGRLSFFFDVCFVVICLVAAMAVRARDLFTPAVLPPLAFAGAILAVALLRPDAIVAGSSVAQTFLAGLAAHAPGLVGGYVAALLTVAARVYARRRS